MEKLLRVYIFLIGFIDFNFVWIINFEYNVKLIDVFFEDFDDFLFSWLFKFFYVVRDFDKSSLLFEVGFL